jgi:signal transduction histidine kinase
LGAIKGGLQVISGAITPLLHDIPRLINRLDPALQAQFWQFLELVRQPSPPVSTKEERSLIRKMESLLEENGIPDPDEMATSLIRIGYHGDITPYLPFLQQVAGDEELKQQVIRIGMLWKQVHTMTAAADKAQQKIKALQFYVGNTSAAAERKAEPVSIQETIDAVLTLYDFYISQGTEVRKEIDVSLTVWAYPQELIQVWTNLIMSAVYAMNKKGTLTITAVREGAFAVISFADTAPEPIDAEHVFDAGTNSRQTQPPVSLAICKLRAEEYGGAIAVRSEGGINCVELRLPLVGA